jgi:hypothetical protein
VSEHLPTPEAAQLSDPLNQLGRAARDEHTEKMVQSVIAGNYPPLLAFLQSPEGNQLGSRLLSLVEALQKSTTEAGAEAKKREIEFQHNTMRLWMKLQATAITIIITVAGVLAWHGKLDATFATLLATLFGYFLGRPAR